MGYNLHITRKENWFDDDPKISLAEWELLVATDPELRLDGYAEAQLTTGGVLRCDDPTMAVWIAHPEHERRDGLAWIWWDDGNVVASHPDEPLRYKMWSLAQTLGAKVQGEEGELYDAAGERIAESTPEPLAAAPKPARELSARPWWKIW